MINPWPYSPASFAPGWPGIPPRWTSSAKSGVGTALTAMSRVWFTLSHGILNEIYYRRPDEACIRDLGLIVIDDQGFFSEEKRHADHQIRSLANGVPGYELVNTHPGHYRITKQIVCDPFRDVVLQRMTFERALAAIGSSPCWRRTSSTPAQAIRLGWANIRAYRSCLPRGAARR
jgi:glucoamylase